MKISKLKFIIIIVLAGAVTLALFQEAFTKERKGYQSPPLLAPVSNNWLQVNNINTIFRSDGYFNYDKITYPGGEAGMMWPTSSSSRLTIDFSTGISVGAKVNGQLRLAWSLYNTHYSAGNIPVIGQVPPTSVCSDPRMKMYQVSLVDPSLFNGGVRQKISQGRTYTCTYDSWASWPVDLGAPYVEVNGLPGYQPDLNGDRPGIGNSSTTPDEILWCVFQDYTNCTNAVHASELSLAGGTVPIGVEIQQTAFAYLSPGLTDMYFVKWKIINKSANQWDSTFIGIVNDADVGYASDDATGCDSAKSVGFIYNFDNDDEGFYGPNPPAIGFKYLQGPLVYTGNQSDTAKLPYGNFVGYIQLGMTNFNLFRNNNDPCLGDPDNATAGYNFLRGRDGCGNPLYNWAFNYPSKYAYNSSLCPRSGWYDSVGADKRFIQASGPFVMHSGDTQVVTIGAFCARGSDNLNSVCKLLENSARVQDFYNSNFKAIPLPPAPTVSTVADGDGKIILYWTNKSESYDQFDSLGLTGSWKFEGYNIYQVKPGTNGESSTDRYLIAVLDVINGITTVYDTLRVLQPDGTTQEEVLPVAWGNNYGVGHYITLIQNKYPSGVNDFFINGQTYKFAVTAYGVNQNAGKPFKVLENPVSAQIVNVIPNYNIMGTELIHNKFDTLAITRPDKVILPVVLDPLKVLSASYKIIFTSDTTWDAWRHYQGRDSLVLRNNNILSILDKRAQIFDGIIFSADTISKANYGVIKDPSSTSQSKNLGWTYTGNRNLAGVDTAVLIGIQATLRPAQSISMGLSWPNGRAYRDGFTSKIDTSFLRVSTLKNVKITFGQTQKAYRYMGTMNNAPLKDYSTTVPFKVEIDDPQDTNSSTPRQLNVGFYDKDSSGTWNPSNTPDGGQEILFIFYSTYSSDSSGYYAKNPMFLTQFRNLDIQYIWWPRLLSSGPAYNNGDVLKIVPYTRLQYQQSPGTVTVIDIAPTTAPTIGSTEIAKNRNELEQVRVVPNPYYGGHAQETSPFDRFVKFMNLPKQVTIYVYSLNGNLVRQISKNSDATSMNWDLLNTDSFPVASGIYIAYIDAPGIGSKIIKLAIFTPEERLDRY
jgi:hypothetical protein